MCIYWRLRVFLPAMQRNRPMERERLLWNWQEHSGKKDWCHSPPIERKASLRPTTTTTKTPFFLEQNNAWCHIYFYYEWIVMMIRILLCSCGIFFPLPTPASGARRFDCIIYPTLNRKMFKINNRNGKIMLPLLSVYGCVLLCFSTCDTHFFTFNDDSSRQGPALQHFIPSAPEWGSDQFSQHN